MLNWFSRELRRLQEVKRDERGFTLIELLVVVIIIGILAAIAIPVFLGQRERAQNANAESVARNAATAAQTYYTDDQTYDGLTIAELREIEPQLPAAGDPDYSTWSVSETDTDFQIQVAHAEGSRIYTATQSGITEADKP